MKYVMTFFVFFSAVLAAAQLSVPEIRFQSVPDFLKLPSDMYLGEVAGAAVDRAGHIYVFQRGNTTGPAYSAAAAQLLEFGPDGRFLREIGRGAPSRTVASAAG